MRVAMVSVHGCPLLAPGSRDAGGMNIYLERLGRELASRDVQVDVFVRWHDPEEPQVVTVQPNFRIVHIEAGGRSPLPKEELFGHLREFLRNTVDFQHRERARYDLVHAHYWLSAWAGARLARDWRVPHVVMFHTLGAVKNQARAGEHEPEVRVRAEQAAIARADAIVTATSQDRQQMERVYAVPPGRVHVIPAGVDLDLFRPIDQVRARTQLGLNGERILLFVGRPDPLKGLEILLSAASLLEHPAGVRVLVIGGQAPDAPAPSAEDAQVTFLGSVGHQLLPYYYNAADVCVIPSYYESFGMVAVEAMACGLPVVASRVGGMQSTVRDGETGYLIPWHCPEPFAERLELLLGNETLRRSFGAAGRTAASSYGWAAVADRVLELYKELLRPVGPYSDLLKSGQPQLVADQSSPVTLSEAKGLAAGQA